jgi:hypothetical protein
MAGAEEELQKCLNITDLLQYQVSKATEMPEYHRPVAVSSI